MSNIRGNEYRIYIFISILLLLFMIIEFCVADQFSYVTLIGDAIFSALFAYIGSVMKKDYEMVGGFAFVLLGIFILFYGWRSYEWLSCDNLFNEDSYSYDHFAGSGMAAKIFLFCHGLKTIFGLFGLMLRVTVFSNPSE